MTSQIKRLFFVPLLAALYLVHPVFGFIGLACAFAVVLYPRRARDEAKPLAP